MDLTAPITLDPKASQETFVSLLQLDPCPMDSLKPDTEEKSPAAQREGDEQRDESQSSRAKSVTSTGTLPSAGLSSSSSSLRGTIFYLSRIHRYSAYAFCIFTSLHVVTTSVIPLAVRSVPASESYVLLARELYQPRLSEPLIVALPVAAHVLSGVALRFLRRRQNLVRYGGATPATFSHRRAHTNKKKPPTRTSSAGWPRLSFIALSGYVFTPFLAAHVYVNRVLPLLAVGDSAGIGLAYVAHGFARHPVASWLMYVGLIGLGTGHMVWGAAHFLGLAQRAVWTVVQPTGNLTIDRTARRARRRLLFVINGSVAAAGLLWAAGGLGVVARGGLAPGWVGKAYDTLFARIPGF